MSQSQKTVEAYDALAPAYEDYSNKKQPYLDAVDQVVMGYIKPGGRLLDVGAGDGRRLAKIKANINLEECVAIEPSSEMAKICEERAQCSVHQVFAEKLDTLDIGQFDTITALWNVFGHIGTTENRLEALCHIREKLEPDGILMLDVNNRHNAVAYGLPNVIGRVIVDTFAFDEKRGDAHYDWQIGDQVFKGFGHLFTPREIENLFKQAGLKIKKRMSFNYATGETSSSPYRGQLFYCLERA